MECNKTYSNFLTKEELFSSDCELNLDIAVSLPQYCEDILSVKRCKADSYVTGCELLNGEIKIHGKTCVNIVYINDSGCLSSFEYEQEFTKSVSTDKDYSDNRVHASLVKKYDNHKIINQRRIDVVSNLTLSVCVYSYCQNSVLDSCENASFKRERYSCLVPICDCQSAVEFDEECEISPESSAVKNIVSCFKHFKVNETKLIKDKLLIKAGVEASVCYITEDDEISKFSASFELSKIVEVPGADEYCDAFINLLPVNFNVKAKANSDNIMRNIEFYGSVQADVEIYKCKEASFSTDCYSKYNFESSARKATLRADGEFACEEKSFNIEAGFNNTDIKEILDLNIYINKRSKNINAHSVDYEFCTEVFFINSAGEYSFANSFETKRFSINREFNFCSSEIQIKSFDYTLKSADKVDVRVSADLSCLSGTQINLNYISDIDISDEEKCVESPALTVYFAKQDEDIWSIAKKFNSDVDLIAEENSITGDKLDSAQIILIPGV